MILLFVNKQRRFDAEHVAAYKALCQCAIDKVMQRSYIDSRLRKSKMVLSSLIMFVGTEHMRKMNRDFRGISQTTDVLTFPLLDMKAGKLIVPLAASDIIPHADGITELPLGEILISLDKAWEQAQEYGHSMEREVAFLATHAALHLIGFDHIDSKEEKRMISEQEQILAEMELSRLPATEDVPVRPGHEILDHSGFVAIIGRPNVGKSTLLNQISGMKLAIVSSKPQTTRKNVRSVVNVENSQIIFIDTPGIHRPKSSLAEYMVEVAFRAANHADMILMMVDATKGNPSFVERESCKQAKESGKKVILAINKADAVDKESLLPIIQLYYSLYAFEAIIPVSARTGDGVPELLTEIIKNLPAGPRFFPDEEVTDQSERTLAGELIREQILHYTNEEIPHGTAVEIELFEERLRAEAIDEYDRDLIKITASIICEKTSHRAILLGKNGQMIKRIGTRARENIEKMCGCKVFLDIHIKVRSDWKNKPEFLSNLGYRKDE
jgi:GTP-binding protein Era/rRNA maturation RNase YbeY